MNDLGRKHTLAPVAERVLIDSSAAAPYYYFTIDLNYTTVLRTVANGSNFTLSLQVQNWAATTDAVLNTAEMKTVTFIVQNGATAYKLTTLNIDGTAQTVKWAGGSAPTGGASAYDVYTFTIIKTAASTYTVLGNFASFK